MRKNNNHQIKNNLWKQKISIMYQAPRRYFGRKGAWPFQDGCLAPVTQNRWVHLHRRHPLKKAICTSFKRSLNSHEDGMIFSDKINHWTYVMVEWDVIVTFIWDLWKYISFQDGCLAISGRVPGTRTQNWRVPWHPWHPYRRGACLGKDYSTPGRIA